MIVQSRDDMIKGNEIQRLRNEVDKKKEDLALKIWNSKIAKTRMKCLDSYKNIC